MNWSTIDFRKILIVLVIAGLPLIAVQRDTSPKNSPWYLKPFGFLMSTLNSSYHSLSTTVISTTGLYLNLWDIKRNNRQLVAENHKLRARLTLFEELSKENHRLRKIVDFKAKTSMNLVASRVIGRDLIDGRNTLRINRGTRHGIKAGQAVISVDGAVGYIFQPQWLTAQVILLTDRYAAIDALVQRTRARGIVEGQNTQTCQLTYIENLENLQVGDLIVTGGLDNIFPKGFPIGTITEVVKSQYGVGQKVHIKPVITPSHLEEVFIIRDASHENLELKTAQQNENKEAAKVKSQ